MELFRKELQPAEVKRRCVCVPRDKWHLFPKVGETVIIQDARDGSIYEVIVGSQYRLGMASWYRQHSEIGPGDEIVFRKENGNVRVDAARLIKPKKEVSLPSLIGREIKGKKVIDVKHVAGKGTVLVIQETREMPVDEVLSELEINEQ